MLLLGDPLILLSLLIHSLKLKVMGFLPRTLLIKEIKSELSGILNCFLSFALNLHLYPIVVLLREFGFFLGFGFPVLNLLFHVLQVLGLLGSESKL